MRKLKFNKSWVVWILKKAEAGVQPADQLRRHGISKTTFFKWRSKYAGASVADVKRLRELEGGSHRASEREERDPYRSGVWGGVLPQLREAALLDPRLLRLNGGP